MTAQTALAERPDVDLDAGQKAAELTRFDLEQLDAERYGWRDEDQDDGMSAQERYDYDRDAEFYLDAMDEARDAARAEHDDPTGYYTDDPDDEY